MKAVYIALMLGCLGLCGLLACGGPSPAANLAQNSGANRSEVSTAPSIDPNSPALNPWVFLTKAYQSGLAEVELAKLVADRSQNAEIKKLAQMIITDQNAINTEIKAVAKSRNTAMPADMGSKRSLVDDLSKLSGADLDKAFVDAIARDHEESAAEYAKQAKASTDPAVKAFAAQTLPTVKKHLDAINAIKANIK